MSDKTKALEGAVRACIEGKRVVSADKNTLTLDDGMTLRLYMSESDCCASANGAWITHPETLEAIITDVKVEVTKDHEYDGDGHTTEAVITILHNQNPVAQADCYANDGNGGYYFSTLSLSIQTPTEDVIDLRVIES